MSASLIATDIVNVFVLTISAKLEPVEPVELVVLVALVDVVAEADDEEPLDDDPAATESPGRRASSDAIVPVTGARNVVSDSACLSFLTVSSSLSTVVSSAAIVAAVFAEPSSAAVRVSCAAGSVAVA